MLLFAKYTLKYNELVCTLTDRLTPVTLCFRLAVGQKRYSGVFMDGTAANNDPFDLRSVFHQHKQIQLEK